VRKQVFQRRYSLVLAHGLANNACRRAFTSIHSSSMML
jgi:hypothetical protein